MAAMLTSSGCALVAGFLYDRPVWLAAVCMVWGLSVVADSAQFSTAVSELCDPRYVGTALTIQTCAGFLLTMGTIRIVPALEPHVGPGWTLAVLALGPLLGTWQMARLRAMPEAVKMASGNR